MNPLSVILVGLGIWIIIDGVGSLAKYRKQTLPEQLIRIIRAIVGAAIIFIAFVIDNPVGFELG